MRNTRRCQERQSVFERLNSVETYASSQLKGKRTKRVIINEEHRRPMYRVYIEPSKNTKAKQSQSLSSSLSPPLPPSRGGGFSRKTYKISTFCDGKRCWDDVSQITSRTEGSFSTASSSNMQKPVVITKESTDTNMNMTSVTRTTHKTGTGRNKTETSATTSTRTTNNRGHDISSSVFDRLASTGTTSSLRKHRKSDTYDDTKYKSCVEEDLLRDFGSSTRISLKGRSIAQRF